MSSYFKTEAVSLFFRQTKEADRVYTLFTQEQGKIEALVRSAAKSQSKLAGSLTPWSLAWIMIAQGKILHVAGVQQLYHWQLLSLQDTALMAVVGQITARLLPLQVPEPKIYEQCVKTLDFIEKSNDLNTKRFVVLKYFWQTLDILGYLLTKPQGWAGQISESAENLRQQCLNGSGKLVCTNYDLAELEQFTFSYIRYIIEDDVPSIQWYVWQQQH